MIMSKGKFKKSIYTVIFFSVLFTIFARHGYAFDPLWFLRSEEQGEEQEQAAFWAHGSFQVESYVAFRKAKVEQSVREYHADIVKIECPPLKTKSLSLEVSEQGQVSGVGEISDIACRWYARPCSECPVQLVGMMDFKDRFLFSGTASGNHLEGNVRIIFESCDPEGKAIRTEEASRTWSARKEGDTVTGEIADIKGSNLKFAATIEEKTETELSPEEEKMLEELISAEESSEEQQQEQKEEGGVSRADISQRIESEYLEQKPILTGKEERTREEKVEFVKDVLGIDIEDFDNKMGESKKAYIIYSDSIDSYRKFWLESITQQTAAAQMLFEELGYQVEIVYPKDSNESFEYMVDPEATAVFNIAHQYYCSLEEIEPDGLPSQFFQAAYRFFQRDYSKNVALQMAKEMNTDCLNKDFFINFSCHSLDNEAIVERTVRPGGAYYGHKGTLYPTEILEERIRGY